MVTVNLHLYYIYIIFTFTPGVGKSSIITRYIKGDYRKECEATIGASFMYAKVTLRDYTITLKVMLNCFITNFLLSHISLIFNNKIIRNKQIMLLFKSRYGIQLDKSGFVV